MHAVVDEAVNAYFPILDQLDEFMDGLEERVFGVVRPDGIARDLQREATGSLAAGGTSHRSETCSTS